jgi:hypothetical protein
MVVRLSALRACRPLPPGTFLVLISVRGWVDTRLIVWLEGLGQSKKSVTPSWVELATLTACSIVSQATTLPRTPVFFSIFKQSRQQLLPSRYFPIHYLFTNHPSVLGRVHVIMLFIMNCFTFFSHCSFFVDITARSSVVGWGTMLQAGRPQFRFPMRSLDFFLPSWHNPSSRTMVWDRLSL